MAPAAQITPIVGPRSSVTVGVVGLSASTQTQENKSSTTATSTIRSTHAGATSTPRKQSTTVLSTRSTNAVGSSTSAKRSTVGSPTVRYGTVISQSTQAPIVVGVSTLQSGMPVTQGIGAVSSTTTTQRTVIIGGQSHGGIHPNLSTLFPAVTQGQHGKSPAEDGGTNTSAVIAGVLVPLILIGAGALMFYIWYRRKYPVRMVVGRDFNRFSNPAYNKRASTVTLVRQDSEKEWERINTLPRKNPNLSIVNEDEPDGVVNNAFELEKEESNGEVIVEKREETPAQDTGTNVEEIQIHEETPSIVGISRERPKTKRAVLVKTDTMEDLENGFELVTESDLGKRTESEVSSGNESTETHTISLSFSETFDNRHKDEQTLTDNKKHDDVNADKIDNNNIQTKDNEKDQLCYEGNDDTVYENTVKTIEPVEKEAEFQNNESITVSADKLVLDATQTETNSPKKDLDITNSSTNPALEEINSDEKPDTSSNDILLKDVHEERDNESDIRETIDHSTQLESNKLSENAINNAEQNESFVFLQEIPAETARSLPADNADESRSAIYSGSPVTDQDAIETEEKPLKHDNSFEILSNTEDVIMKSSNLVEDIDESKTQNNENVLEKEKFELLEKENVTQIKVEKGMIDCSSVDIDGTQSLFTTEDKDSEILSGLNDIQRKKPSLTLSNDNIVLEAAPQTPTVFVQESFILETETTPLVYLDNTSTNQGRGRRAFTLDDIVMKQSSGDTHGLSLPKGMDEISKSSPDISELKSPEFPDLNKMHFDYVSPGKKDKENSKISSKDIFDQNSRSNESCENKEIDTAIDNHIDKENIFNAKECQEAINIITTKNSESSGQDTFNTLTDKNEDKKHISDAQEGQDTANTHAIQNSERPSVSVTQPKNDELENGLFTPTEFQTESVDMLTSIESNSFELDQEQASNLSTQLTGENVPTHFTDIETEEFNFFSADRSLVQNLDDTTNRSSKTDHEDDKLPVDSFDLFSQTKPERPLESTSQSNNDNEHKPVAPGESFNDDSLFFNNFPQSSTPTTSIIDDLVENADENSRRKKVLPQMFDFENLSNSENDQEKSGSSSESEKEDFKSLEEISNEHVKSFSIFESEVLGLEKQAIENERDGAFQKENISSIEDVSNLTRSTDSSTALSWDLLSGESSHDSSNIDNFYKTSKDGNAPVLLESSVNHDQDNDPNAPLTITSEHTNMFEFMTEVPNQTASNNTSIGSAGLTDLSWEVVNEEVDNSEC